jgi:hypothetical protein
MVAKPKNTAVVVRVSRRNSSTGLIPIAGYSPVKAYIRIKMKTSGITLT